MNEGHFVSEHVESLKEPLAIVAIVNMLNSMVDNFNGLDRCVALGKRGTDRHHNLALVVFLMVTEDNSIIVQEIYSTALRIVCFDCYFEKIFFPFRVLRVEQSDKIICTICPVIY